MRKYVLLSILAIFVLSIAGAWTLARFITSPALKTQNKVVFQVSPGESFNEVSMRLYKKKLLTSIIKFKIVTRLSSISTQVKAGEYELHTRMSPIEILKILAAGKSIEYPITFQEGINMYEIAELFERQGLGSKNEFLKLCRDKAFIQELLGGQGQNQTQNRGQSHNQAQSQTSNQIQDQSQTQDQTQTQTQAQTLASLEGYLFPETYFVTKSTDASTLIKTMVKRFKAVYNLVKSSAQIPMAMHDHVTLASIIEKETGDPRERPMIASVFHNRFKKKMKLQSDPTILYGMLELNGGIMPRNIRKQDILNPTRYNTYTVAALPYGPIANPGQKSLEAAVNPASTNHLFFVSRNDGTHVFSKTLEEHNRAVQTWQLNSKNRKGKSWRQRYQQEQTQSKTGSK